MQSSVFCEVENGLTIFFFLLSKSWKRISREKLRENMGLLIVRDTTFGRPKQPDVHKINTFQQRHNALC
jgi:hypothetical protein